MIAAAVLAAVLAADFDVPGAIDQVDLPEPLRAMGVPVTLRAVRSKEKPDALLQHFATAFEKAGLFVPEHGELRSAGNLIQVTGFDVVKRTSFSVLLQPNQDGTTTVVLGEAALHAGRRAPPAGGFAPVFPGATGLVTSSLETGQSLAYQAKATAAEVGGFYRETLASAGFVETEPLHFEKRGARVRVWVKPRGADAVGVVVLRQGP